MTEQFIQYDPMYKTYMLLSGVSQVAQWWKNPHANAGDTRDSSSTPDQEDPLEEETATQSSIISSKIPWTEEPGGPQSMGSQGVGHNWACMHACICTPYVYKFIGFTGQITSGLKW